MKKTKILALIFLTMVSGCGSASRTQDFADFTGYYEMLDTDCDFDASRNLSIQPSGELLSVATDFETLETWLMAHYEKGKGYRYGFDYDGEVMHCFVSYIQDEDDINSLLESSDVVNVAVGDILFDCENADSVERCSIVYENQD